jgi:hypothetical protein
MRPCRIQLFAYSLALLCIPYYAVPVFDVNLDGSPEDRWSGIVTYYKPEMLSMLERLVPQVSDETLKNEHKWINGVVFDQEYETELKGIVRVLNDPKVTLERLKWLNMLYEMHGPDYIPGCTSILWVHKNGTVLHGRNTDDDSPGSMGLSYGPIIFEATLHRSGRPLIRLTTMPGMVGVHTGMRYGHKGNGKGWAFAQHARRLGEWDDNLKAADWKSHVSSLAIRRIMESTDDYETAVKWLYATPFIAPHYFVVSGAGPRQGAVLTIERLALQYQTTPPLVGIPNEITGDKSESFLIATNDEPWVMTPQREWDPRKQAAHELIMTHLPHVPGLEVDEADPVNEDNLLQIMHIEPITYGGTVHTTIMAPATGYYKTTLPNEGPDQMPIQEVEYFHDAARDNERDRRFHDQAQDVSPERNEDEHVSIPNAFQGS